MTTKPELKLSANLARGASAIVLFVVLAFVFLRAGFGDPVGFGAIESVTAGLGFAMFDVAPETIGTGTESFLVAFEIIDVVLIAALAAAVMLARREVDGKIVTALFTRGDDK